VEFSRNVRRHNGQTLKAGTQMLDKCLDHCKEFTCLLRGDLWNWIYQWQWRYNSRHNLWQIMPYNAWCHAPHQ
jgi:hypothetical protein